MKWLNATVCDPGQWPRSCGSRGFEISPLRYEEVNKTPHVGLNIWLHLRVGKVLIFFKKKMGHRVTSIPWLSPSGERNFERLQHHVMFKVTHGDKWAPWDRSVNKHPGGFSAAVIWVVAQTISVSTVKHNFRAVIFFFFKTNIQKHFIVLTKGHIFWGMTPSMIRLQLHENKMFSIWNSSCIPRSPSANTHERISLLLFLFFFEP